MNVGGGSSALGGGGGGVSLYCGKSLIFSFGSTFEELELFINGVRFKASDGSGFNVSEPDLLSPLSFVFPAQVLTTVATPAASRAE